MSQLPGPIPAPTSLTKDSFPLFRHQVAGHFPLLWREKAIYKPVQPSEACFYENMKDWFPALVPFTPKFYGVVSLLDESKSVDSNQLANTVPTPSIIESTPTIVVSPPSQPSNADIVEASRKLQSKAGSSVSSPINIPSGRVRASSPARAMSDADAAAHESGITCAACSQGDHHDAHFPFSPPSHHAEQSCQQRFFNHHRIGSNHHELDSSLDSNSNSASMESATVALMPPLSNMDSVHSILHSRHSSVSEPPPSPPPSLLGSPTFILPHSSHPPSSLPISSNSNISSAFNPSLVHNSIQSKPDGLDQFQTSAPTSSDIVEDYQKRMRGLSFAAAVSSSVSSESVESIGTEPLPISNLKFPSPESMLTSTTQPIEAPASGRSQFGSDWSSRLAQKKDKKKSSKKITNKYLVLEDLTSQYKQPCILDLKLGVRQHGLNETPEKIASKLQKVRNSTSSSLGLRMCGMQVYHPAEKEFIFRDKYFGRDIDSVVFENTLVEFLDNGVCFREDLIPLFIERLESFQKVIGLQHDFRFYSSSLLMLYEGDVPDDFDAASSNQSIFSRIDIRFIDFAHAARAPDVEIGLLDCGLLMGIQNLIHLLMKIYNHRARNQMRAFPLVSVLRLQPEHKDVVVGMKLTNMEEDDNGILNATVLPSILVGAHCNYHHGNHSHSTAHAACYSKESAVAVSSPSVRRRLISLPVCGNVSVDLMEMVVTPRGKILSKRILPACDVPVLASTPIVLPPLSLSECALDDEHPIE